MLLLEVRREAHPQVLVNLFDVLLMLRDVLLERDVEEHLLRVQALHKHILTRHDGVLHLHLRPLNDDLVELRTVIRVDVRM